MVEITSKRRPSGDPRLRGQSIHNIRNQTSPSLVTRLNLLHALERPERAVHRLLKGLAGALQPWAAISIMTVDRRLGKRAMHRDDFENRSAHVGQWRGARVWIV